MDLIGQINYLLTNSWKYFLQGLLATMLLAIIGTAVGLFLGIFLALLRNIKIQKSDKATIKILKAIGIGFATIHIEIWRGIPMMVQAMIVFFGFAALGAPWSNIGFGTFFNGYMQCGLFVISVNTSAYMAEIVRAGINSLDPGQAEAARSLGMSYSQTTWSVVVPQAIKNSLPTIGNEFIVNIKDSAVLNVIGLTELYACVSAATNKNYFQIAGYIIVAVIYLILTLLTSLLIRKLSKKRKNGPTISGKPNLSDPDALKHYKPEKNTIVANPKQGL
jgi:putative lysine transport system permease protein